MALAGTIASRVRGEPESCHGAGDSVRSEVIESGLAAHYNSRRVRLWRAWAGLRGRAWPFLEFYTAMDLEDFIATLREAGAVAFPPAAREQKPGLANFLE